MEVEGPKKIALVFGSVRTGDVFWRNSSEHPYMRVNNSGWPSAAVNISTGEIERVDPRETVRSCLGKFVCT